MVEGLSEVVIFNVIGRIYLIFFFRELVVIMLSNGLYVFFIGFFCFLGNGV